MEQNDYLRFSEDGKTLIRCLKDYVRAVVIPDGVTKINFDAFSRCYSLVSIKIPNSVTEIGIWAFQYCTSLTSIEIPNGVIKIFFGAFAGCTSLTSIKFPDSVTEIENAVFDGCTSLRDIYLEQTTPLVFSEHTFDGLDKTKVTMHVPKGSGEAYRNSEYYSGFMNIIEE